jgi:hypothetical protein
MKIMSDVENLKLLLFDQNQNEIFESLSRRPFTDQLASVNELYENVYKKICQNLNMTKTRKVKN